MDEFARMMRMEGVRPLDQVKKKALAPTKKPGPAPGRGIVATTEPAGYAWVTGSRARVALETALERLAVEVRDGRRGWATGIRTDGTSMALATSAGAASLLGTADRQSLRLMIVGGDGWTFVMHPLMGVATLDEDPSSLV